MKNTHLFIAGFMCMTIVVCCMLGCSKSDPVAPPPVSPPVPVVAVTSFSPTSDTVGGTITITGANFNTDTSKDVVKFNGAPAIIKSATTMQLVVIVPSAASNGPVSVITNGQAAASSGSFTVTPLVTITGFTPASDTLGAVITISGTNFNTTAAYDTVTFNGAVALVQSAYNNLLKVTVPAAATSGRISVKIGNQKALSATDFTIPPPSISSFSPVTDTVGGLVVITGSNFSSIPGYDSVMFNGAAAVIVSASPTQLTAFVPDYALIGKISVKTGAQTCYSTGIFTITGVSTLAGTVDDYYNDGTGIHALFKNPQGLATDADNNIYVSDFNQRIRKITPEGVTTTIAGSGINGESDGMGYQASFNEPLGITVDGNGIIYVADNASNLLRKITPGGVVTTLATIQEIHSVAADKNGNVYVAGGNYAVTRVAPDGTQTVFAGSILFGGYTDGQGAAARFAGISGLAVDANGNVYVSDNGNQVIREITPSGMVTTIAGVAGVQGSTDGPVATATFFAPRCLAVDAAGNIYVNDINRVRKINPFSGMVTNFAGGDSYLPLSLNGSYPVATFDLPPGICTDNQGNVFVTSVNSIRRIAAH